MTGNNIILRIVKDGVTHDLQVDKNVPLRVDMSTLESQQIGKLFGIGSQEFNIPGTNQSNAFFDFAFNPGTDTAVGSTKIRLFKAAWTLSIRLRSSHVLMSCRGSSKSYRDWP